MSEEHTDHSLPCWACFMEIERTLTECLQQHHSRCRGWEPDQGAFRWCQCACHEFAWPKAISRLKIFSGGF